MANTVAIKFLGKGSRSIIISVFLKSDGVSGELTEQTLIDPVVDLGLKSNDRLTLVSVMSNLTGFDAILEFDSDGVDPNFKWALVAGTNSPTDFSPLGGIVDDSGMDGTGKLQLTTSGFTSSSDFGSILIKLRH